MNNTANERTELNVFADDVTDETLETAAGSKGFAANFTLGACTGLSVCPGE